MHVILRDFRIGFRSLLRRPLLLATGALTLAVGIGASTGVFSVVEAALLRPLPFDEADRLAIIWGVAGPERDIRGASFPEVRDWGAGVDALGPLAPYNATTTNLVAEGGARQLTTEAVGADFFTILGIAPALGRGFAPDDDLPGAPGSAVLSHDLWQRLYDGDADVLGRTMRLDDLSFTVVGVMPEGFRGLSFDTEIWVPFGPFFTEAGMNDRGTRFMAAVGRLAPGATPEVAQQQLDAIAARLAEVHPEMNEGRGAMLQSLRDFYVAGVAPLLLLVLGGVLVLLLIAAANVAGLQLVRAVERRREVAVRSAMGAGAVALVRQLTVESVILAAIGGAAGLALAALVVPLLVPLIPAGVLPPTMVPALDGPVLLFGVAATTLAAILAAAVPAARVARQAPSVALRGGGRGIVEGGRAQHIIIVAEVALALVLLVGAGLAVRSLQAQLDLEPGFQPDNTLVARVSFGSDGPDAAGRRAFARDLLDRLSAEPGVQGAGAVMRAPLRGYDNASYIYRADRPIDTENRVRFYLHPLTPGTLDVLGVALVEGRGITPADHEEAPPVAVVSQAFAQKVWPGEEPLGRRLHFAGDTITVVGVAANVRQRVLTTDLMDPGEDPDVYFSYAQLPARNLDIVVRTAGDPTAFTGAVRRAVAELAPSVPVYDVSTLRRELDAQTALGRLVSWLLGSFAVLALFAAGIGLFGVLAFVVRGRRRELAIRNALGAAPATLQRMVVLQGLALVGMGLAVGGVGAWIAGRIAAAQLFGVEPLDPLVMAGTATLLLLVGAVASAIPAAQAMRIDPRTVMADE